MSIYLYHNSILLNLYLIKQNNQLQIFDSRLTLLDCPRYLDVVIIYKSSKIKRFENNVLEFNFEICDLIKIDIMMTKKNYSHVSLVININIYIL